MTDPVLTSGISYEELNTEAIRLKTIRDLVLRVTALEEALKQHEQDLHPEPGV
jgi:hypothetical protein